MTTSLNPNAEVFQSSQPVTSSAAIDTATTHWSDPMAPDLAVTNISTGFTCSLLFFSACINNTICILMELVIYVCLCVNYNYQNFVNDIITCLQ